MSKMITLTDESISKIKEEFAKALMGAIPDGKINFQKTIGVIQRKAELRFKELAWYKMQALIKECDKEVGWHGVARRGENPEKDEYIIDDILVYPQEVTGGNVETDQKQYQMWLMSHDDETFNNIRMHGHSHVNMQTNPSVVDTTFYDEILRQLDNTMFYIFMIWNKRGDHTIKIYDMAKNVLFENADVTISVFEDDTGIVRFITESKKMISERKYTPAAATSIGVNTYCGGLNNQSQHLQTYKNNEASSQPVAASAAKPTVVASTGGNDSQKKSGKKHRVVDWQNVKHSLSYADYYGYSSIQSDYSDDFDDPYGPYGYRDQYYGYED